jgi:solute carrier family 35 (UDP-sugar transporter), member A1/2/3
MAVSPNSQTNNLKWISLIVLIAQTTALVLILRFSRTQKTEGPRYLSSTAVVTAEVVKFFTCIVVLFINSGKFIRFPLILYTG